MNTNRFVLPAGVTDAVKQHASKYLKTMKKNNLLPLLALLAWSCGSHGVPQGNVVYVDTHFTQLSMPDSGGVSGADGMISILLDDGSSLFMTGDCFVGKVRDGKRDPAEELVNNSLIHIGADYRYLGAYYGGTPENPLPLCSPREAAHATYAYWYWPGHGFQRGNTLYLFMTKFYQGGEGQWGFRFDGTDLVKIDMTDYSVRSIETLYDGSCPVHWGHCVMMQDDFYYIYGTRSGVEYNPAQLCVSRAKFDTEAERLGSFTYYDGKEWSADPAAAAGCEGLDVSVSEQFSVFRYEDVYVLLTQRRAQQAGEIYTYVSDTPVGPWRNRCLHYVTTEQVNDSELFTYNAMAHPQFLNERNELLICYNINSYNLSKPYEDASTYRPIFLRVPMSRILE